ncbi:MAG: hypothetical protein ACR2NQ_00370 [Thermodesulfobacteriota bacterium]
MADLEKLDKTINELDETSKELKGYSKIYKEIATLKQTLSSSKAAVDQSADSIKEAQKNLSQIASTTVEKIESVIKEQKQQGEKTQEENKQNFALLLENIKLNLEKQNQHIENMGKTFSLSSDNTQKSMKETLENVVNLQKQLSDDIKKSLIRYLVAITLFATSVGVGIALYFKGNLF